MMMNMLKGGGLDLGIDEIRKADEDNPKGYFELEQVKDLDKGDKDPGWLRAYRGKGVKIISFLIPHLPSDNYYKIVFMRRELDEVMASQAKMLTRRDEEDKRGDDEKMKRNYSVHLKKVNFEMRESMHIDHLYVDYKEVVKDPRAQAEAIASFLDMNLDPAKMAAAVDAKLYRNRS
ncbi:hypothetical protein ABI59_09795 [Acidobacteria bacterium Mor1]|nr:hypothetical protein ABI59_09795 [Acidobacteria bacterium Mor1]